MEDPNAPDRVVMASFSIPPERTPEFESILKDTIDRWKGEAESAGLDPETSVDVIEDDGELHVRISAELDKIFTPDQTEWRAV